MSDRYDAGASEPLAMPSPPSSGPDLVLQGRSFNLTFNEEFDQLDISPWEAPLTRWTAPPTGQFGDAHFRSYANPDRPYTVQRIDGRNMLRIEAWAEASTGLPWSSGAIQTVQGRTWGDNGGNGFSQVGGYWETRMKLPPGAGCWPSFWLRSLEFVQNGKDKHGEIDIFEHWGGEPDAIYINVHRWGRHGQHYAPPGRNYVALANGEFHQDFHRFGCWIDEAARQLKFYVDRVLQPDVTVDIGDKSKLAWLQGRSWFPVLSLAVDLKNGTPPSPSYLLVDYVKAYKEKLL